MASSYRLMVFSNNRIINQCKNRGFTMIELIVVIGILVVITGIILANYGRFGSAMLLRNLTYDLALTVREAQVYSISGKFQDVDVFAKVPIIVYFDLTGGYSHPFYMFRDVGLDWQQTNLATENINNYNLGHGFKIVSIEANGGTVTGITKLAIAFQRPEPDADIRDGITSAQYSDARIIVQSPEGKKLSVFIEGAGQISVQRVTTP